jgi:hypothetical protein
LTHHARRRTASILALVLFIAGILVTTQGTRGLSDQDRKDIARIVVHSIAPPVSSERSSKFSLALSIDEDDSGELARHVISTYPKTQRFVSNESRFERDSCFFDRETGGPSLGIGLGKIQVIDNVNVLIDAGSAICIMGTEGSTYRLQKNAGEWKLVTVEQNYII